MLLFITIFHLYGTTAKPFFILLLSHKLFFTLIGNTNILLVLCSLPNSNPNLLGMSEQLTFPENLATTFRSRLEDQKAFLQGVVDNINSSTNSKVERKNICANLCAYSPFAMKVEGEYSFDKFSLSLSGKKFPEHLPIDEDHYTMFFKLKIINKKWFTDIYVCIKRYSQGNKGSNCAKGITLIEGSFDQIKIDPFDYFICECGKIGHNGTKYCISCYPFPFQPKHHDCPICLSNDTGLWVKPKNCSHAFHYACVKNLDKCPMCREPFVGHDPLEKYFFASENPSTDSRLVNEQTCSVVKQFVQLYRPEVLKTIEESNGLPEQQRFRKAGEFKSLFFDTYMCVIHIIVGEDFLLKPKISLCMMRLYAQTNCVFTTEDFNEAIELVPFTVYLVCKCGKRAVEGHDCFPVLQFEEPPKKKFKFV